MSLARIARPMEFGRWPGRLTEDVGVDQIPRNASVDSDIMGTKKPLLRAREEPLDQPFV
jgi:hypothetical protein